MTRKKESGAPRGPSFICPGLEKTGTSWLYLNLQQHPEVYLPLYKEIRYFWERFNLPDENILKRFTRSHWHYRTFQGYLIYRFKHYGKNLHRINARYLSELRWDCNFLFRPHNDKWYLSLFDAAGGRVSGDISPNYYTLPASAVADVHRLLPRTKIIILLRNPIDRVWSKAKMNLCLFRNRALDEVPAEAFYRRFDEIYRAGPSYVNIIDRWAGCWPADRVHVNFYDKLAEDPAGFAADICSFLGIDVNRFPDGVRARFERRVGEGVRIDLPPEYAVYLAERYSDCVEELCARYDGYPRRWLDACRRILRSGTPDVAAT